MSSTEFYKPLIRYLCSLKAELHKPKQDRRWNAEQPSATLDP